MAGMVAKLEVLKKMRPCAKDLFAQANLRHCIQYGLSKDMANMNSVVIPEKQTPCGLTEDRISSLPWDVLNIILRLLPFLEAVRTSILAKDWRFRWLSLSVFSLDCNKISFKDNNDSLRWKLVSSIINKYIGDHTGPITEFYLDTNIFPRSKDMNQWIQYLSTQNVEVLSLRNCMGSFWVPSPLFSFKKLKKLFLIGCTLIINSDFKGFNSLHSLYLRDVVVNGGKLNLFIASCPVLEKLIVLCITGLTVLRVHAPRLTSLFVDSNFEDIVIEVAPCLATVIIDDISDRGEGLNFNTHGITRNLLGLDTIKELGVSGEMIKLLAVDYGVGDFPWRNSTLTTLVFDSMVFDTVEVFHVFLSLLSSCSNVRHLFVTPRSAKGPKLITNFLKENQGRFSFPELISLDMSCPEGVGMGCMVNFLEFIGAHSPNIKFLTVVKDGRKSMNRTRVRQMLTRLRKACPQASVGFVRDHVPTGYPI